jgi:hypothetical protein
MRAGKPLTLVARQDIILKYIEQILRSGVLTFCKFNSFTED